MDLILHLMKTSSKTPPATPQKPSKTDGVNNASKVLAINTQWKDLKPKPMSIKQKPEEAFYEHLTLGLMGVLENVPRVCNVEFEKRQPCEKAQVVNWEQRHCVYLPEDMKKFYLSTDGFILYWSYQYAPNDVRRVGYIHFPHLLQITLLRENIDITHNNSNNNNNGGGNYGNAALEHPATTTAVGGFHPIISSNNSNNNCNNKDLWGNPTPVITAKTKIFEVNTINDQAKVCMIYETTGTNNPKFYLLELGTFKWQFLADTFSEYLRMSIAHLGLPYWELCFSTFGLPSWAEQLFLLLAPHLLEEREPRRRRLINPTLETPYNIINPNVFRGKPKNSAKPATTAKHK